MLGILEDFGVCDIVSPLDIQDASQITKVENVEVSLLLGIESPHLTAVK